MIEPMDNHVFTTASVFDDSGKLASIKVLSSTSSSMGTEKILGLVSASTCDNACGNLGNVELMHREALRSVLADRYQEVGLDITTYTSASDRSLFFHVIKN
jgi:hypothetical protein